MFRAIIDLLGSPTFIIMANAALMNSEEKEEEEADRKKAKSKKDKSKKGDTLY
jgi:hypothetical protein